MTQNQSQFISEIRPARRFHIDYLTTRNNPQQPMI